MRCSMSFFRNLNPDYVWGSFLFTLALFVWVSFIQKQEQQVWELHNTCEEFAGTAFDNSHKRMEIYRECMGGE